VLILPEGTIYKTAMGGKFKHGKSVEEKGNMQQGVIIGGNGKYTGIRGGYEVEIIESGKVAKTTHKFWLGQ
jgi:hypothetical protein